MNPILELMCRVTRFKLLVEEVVGAWSWKEGEVKWRKREWGEVS